MDRELKNRLDLAGVDRKKALERFMGKDELYEEFLYRFLEDKNIAIAEKALEDGDFKKAEYAVHNLKGISGTLGMVKLYEDCAAFMKLMRDHSLSYGEVWHRMKNEFTGICRMISGEGETP